MRVRRKVVVMVVVGRLRGCVLGTGGVAHERKGEGLTKRSLVKTQANTSSP